MKQLFSLDQLIFKSHKENIPTYPLSLLMEPPKPEPSLSDTSSIISAPPCPPIKPNQPEGEEQQQPQEQEEDANHDLVLDLSLCNKDSDHGSKPELNLIDCFKTNITDAMDRAPEGNETEPRVFSCNYCQRKFYSSQALGGHQNAHKRERTLAKRGHRLGSAASSLAFGHPNRYSSMSSLPLHGSFNRSLGIQAHAMISKPSYISSTIGSSHIYGRNSWPRRPINQQPAIGRLAPENSHLGTNIGASSPTGAARFDSLLKFSPVSEDISGYWWDSVARLKTKQDELKKLDLSLKL